MTQSLIDQFIGAASKGKLEEVQKLHALGAPVDGLNHEKSTALMWAAYKGHTEVVKFLIEAGADINLQNRPGETALIVASQKGYADIVQLLIETEKLKMDMKDKGGNSALLWAVEKGRFDIVKLLVEADADLNIRDHYGHTPLIWAAVKGHADIAELLIKAGARLDLRDDGGKTVRDHASKKIMRFIENAKALSEQYLRNKTAQADRRKIALLQQKRSNPDDLDSIIAYGTVEQLRALYDESFWRGAKIKAEWRHLKIAILKKDPDMGRLLVTWGASATPGDLAALQAERPDIYPELVETLRQCGMQLSVESAQKQKAPIAPPPRPEPGPTAIYACNGLVAAPYARDVFGDPLFLSFNEAARHVKKMNLERYLGHNDWRLPTNKEWARILENAKNGYPLYLGLVGMEFWSATPSAVVNVLGWKCRPSDQKILHANKNSRYAVQPVRSLPPDPEIGALIPGEGIYLGRYTPKDRDGNSLSKTFNVFAAPEDLGDVATYLDTVWKISNLRNWHGHNGGNYANDKELYAALKNGSYKGEWVPPTKDILHGEDVDGNVTMADNMWRHKDTGAFAGTYATPYFHSFHDIDCYWSCTEKRNNPDYVWNVFLLWDSGKTDQNKKGNLRFSCRPVRLVPVVP